MKKEKLMKIQERLVFLLIFLFLLPIGVIAQQKMITGQVVDEQGEAVIGASVMVKGAKTGTITDLDGNFSVQGKAGQTLSISYVGYTPLDVKITKLQNNRFVLKENTEVLDEVVVVGMDTQKRNTITAAVSVVKGDDIVNRPITDLTSALQGNVAGLNFASDAMGGAKGGELGTDIKFNIRGVGSINGGEPYVLVDGIEQSMQNVNPADVASISVLKDASAAAIYGARAAYGVVLVTTKSGNSEKAKVSYSGTVGFSSPIRTPQMMNSLEFAYYNNALYDAGASASGINRISDSVIEKIKGFMQNPYSEEFPGIDVSSNGEDWASAYYAQYGNTDWFKYYYKDKSIRHSHNLSVQGGSQKINYYIGMGYVYQEGFLDHVKDDLSKYNLNTKLQAKPTDWLRFNLNNNITLQMIKRPMPNQSIIYNKIGSHRPSQVTHLPIDSKYNIPSWNETLFMQNSNYENNRLSDALSVSATATLMKGWDVTAEMKIRFDVENNNMILYENPQYETPLGTLKPGDLTENEIGIRLRATQQNPSVLPAESLYAIEHDTMDTTFRSMYQGLYIYLSARKERRDLLLSQRPPRFDESLDSMISRSEDDFTRIALKAKAAQDYFLLIGPPGTGKTSCALKKMVETFHADKDAQILLLSYTNRAVDEICKSLASIAPAVDFIRVGSELSCDEAYRGHLIENELSSCNRRSEVYERIRNCRIIVGTVAAISGKPELFRLKHFDVAIIDEATQILEPQLLGILCARGEDGKDAIDKFVLIGDHKQLPAVVQQNTEQSAIYDESLLSIGLTNLKDSLFERLYRNCTATVHRSYDMLCRQGRMHPEVALFANRAFYGGRLIPVGLPHQIESSDTICRLAFYPSVPEKVGASAKINYSEARIVADLAVRIYEDHQTDFDESRTLGIITPYRSQIALIKKEIESLGIPALNRILVDTVERFQGSERDVIIYSFCVNYPYQLKFLSNLTEEEGVLIDRKLNVALTRARKQMFITGVSELLERNPLYKSLLKLIESF